MTLETMKDYRKRYGIKKRKKELSDVPSKAILQAVDDIKSIFKLDRVSIYMSRWVCAYGWHEEWCCVCQAGAVALYRSNLGMEMFNPNNFSKKAVKIRSFDFLRKGLINSFLRYFCYNDSAKSEISKENVSKIIYMETEIGLPVKQTQEQGNWSLYCKHLKRLSKELQKLGL